ncbi:hypothetical protein [Tessaracoccus massiliensis]|uniref:hypothetical protein n=1 Tax=Tessaracoccus massiliensis TaxID=1522311 RepID=UPI00058E56F9|nr:hypothetical protein [Tessaracoccus massiliensis]
MPNPVAPWTLLATDAPVGQLMWLTVAISSRPERGPHQVTILEVDKVTGVAGLLAPASRVSVKTAGLGATDRPRTMIVPDWLRLDDLVAERLDGGEIEHVLVVPGVRWPVDRVFGQDEPTAVTHGPRSSEVYDERQILARLDAQPKARSRKDGHSPSGARARVDRVKERLGAMTTDVIYRIENSALFDTSVPLTRQFNLLMMRWDDEQARLGAAALDRLSMEVELAFTTARDHAETVGLSHLPATAQPDARRALKAAELANRATSEGEREAALLQVTRLLESIALFYLPAPADVPRMIGGSAPQLGSG